MDLANSVGLEMVADNLKGRKNDPGMGGDNLKDRKSYYPGRVGGNPQDDYRNSFECYDVPEGLKNPG